MLNFGVNFFFIKWSILFFIITIFGYWGIDLNSEELYIAFSFFFLVILLFVAVRHSILLFFVKAVNTKYSNILSGWFFILESVDLYIESLSIIEHSLVLFSRVTSKFAAFLNFFIFSLFPIFVSQYQLKVRYLYSVIFTGQAIFAANLIRLRKASLFYGGSSKFFNIKL